MQIFFDRKQKNFTKTEDEKEQKEGDKISPKERKKTK